MHIFDHIGLKKPWRRDVVESPIILPNVYRCNVFAKARKQQKEVAACGLRRSSVSKYWRSAAEADPAEKINLKNNRLDREFSPHAKTHQRCDT